MRPRPHELEDESRRAFAAALPAWAVIRDESPDYGYDFEVEVFRDGVSTGHRLLVQVKSSDNPGPREEYPFRTERLAMYFFRAPLPVMLVGYDASTRTLRALWAEDAYATLATHPRWYSRERTLVAFVAAPTLSLDSADTIIRRGLSELPPIHRHEMRCHVSAPSWSDADISWVLGLVSAGLPAGDIRSSDPGHANVVLSGGVAGGTMNVYAQHESFAHRVGTVRLPLMRADEARDRLDLPVDWKESLRILNIAIRMAGAQTSPGRNRLTPLLGQLLHDPIPLSQFDQYTLALCTFADGALESLLRSIQARGTSKGGNFTWVIFARFLGPRGATDLSWARVIDSLAASEADPVGKAALLYSAGNGYRSDGQWALAFARLRAAERLVPEYRERGYWNHDLGIALFELGRHRAAASAYTRALCMGGKPEDLCPKIADCFLQMGDAATAARWFEASAYDRLGRPWWALRHWAAAHIAAHLCDKGQKLLSTAERRKLHDSGGRDGSEGLAAVRLLILDRPEDGLAWFNLAVALGRAGDRVGAATGWAVCAALQDWDVEACANAALTCAVHSPESAGELPIYVILTAYERGGERFLGQLDALLDAQGRPELVAPFREYVRSVIGERLKHLRARVAQRRMVVEEYGGTLHVEEEWVPEAPGW